MKKGSQLSHVEFVNDHFYIQDNINSHIYRLPINEKVEKATKIMNHAQTKFIPVFKKGPAHNTLILNSKNSQMIVLKFDKKGDIEKKIEIQDYMKFLIDYTGYGQNGIVRIARDGRIKLFELDFSNGHQEYVAALDMPLNDKRGESPFKVVSDLKGEFFAVHLQDENFNASRILLYHYEDEKLVLKADCDVYEDKMARFFAMDIIRNYGGKVSIIAISNAKAATNVLTFEFDVKNSFLQELKPLRKTMKLNALQGFRRVGEFEFVAADVHGGVFEILYSEG